MEIVGDTRDIQELIDYLNAVKDSKDHMYLIIDSEINPYPISEKMEGTTLFAKHVRFEYNDKSSWDSQNK